MMPRLEATARHFTRTLDAAMHRLYGWRRNPLHQSGALAVWLLLVLTVTGLYLLVFYRVGAPAASVQRIAGDIWLGAWIRSLHRYATDAFVIAAVLHAVRLLGQAREWGPRARAWITGVLLVAVGLGCAWSGFVMAWDSFGMRLAVAGARVIDVLPILSEPVGRIFAEDRAPPSAFFFLNLFLHIAMPLAMGVGLWVHVSRVARPALLPPRAIRWGVTAALMFVAIVVPAALGPPASPLTMPSATPVDLVTSWWLPLVESAPASLSWLALVAGTALVLLVPWAARRERVASWAPSVVDPRLCTGCDQCTQDCPWEAITMVPRADARPTLVALVDPTRCVSCGICAGSCAPMGVGPPLRTGRDQLAALEAGPLAALRTAVRDDRVVVICCAQAPAGARRALGAAGALMHEVPCVGGVHSSVVERFVREGAAGVLIAGCPPRDCVGREGPKWLEQRLYHDREAELQPRVDRRRVRVMTVAAALDREAVAGFDQFRRDLRALAIPTVDETAADDPQCETTERDVALAAATSGMVDA